MLIIAYLLANSNSNLLAILGYIRVCVYVCVFIHVSILMVGTKSLQEQIKKYELMIELELRQSKEGTICMACQ